MLRDYTTAELVCGALLHVITGKGADCLDTWLTRDKHLCPLLQTTWHMHLTPVIEDWMKKWQRRRDKLEHRHKLVAAEQARSSDDRIPNAHRQVTGKLAAAASTQTPIDFIEQRLQGMHVMTPAFLGNGKSRSRQS